MFGWLKKSSQDRVLKIMDSLSYLANITTAYKINSLLKDSRNYKDDDELNKIIAVRTNYLFGRNVSDSHSNLDVKAEFISANDWLSSDSLFRELVVQSLRVMNTSRMAKGGELIVLGEDILKTYGYLFINEPTIDSYRNLVFKAIDSLESNDKLDVLDKAKKYDIS